MFAHEKKIAFYETNNSSGSNKFVRDDSNLTLGGWLTGWIYNA